MRPRIFSKLKRSSSKRGNKAFALIIPRFEDIFHSYYAGEIIKGVGFAASRLQADILMHITERFDHHDWLESPLLELDYIDGLIFADINSDIDMLRRVVHKGIPYIVLNNYFEEPINCISINNQKAAFDLTERLINLGHRRIATITGDLSTQAGQLRLKGYKEAMRANDIDVREEYLTSGDFLRTPARRASEQLLSLQNRPTAIFAASDVMALELIDEARKKKIEIPQELSIIGFDDNPLNSYSPVGLTTIAQPLAEMGRLGVEHLSRIVQRTTNTPTKVLLETRFVERDTMVAVKSDT